MSARQHEPDQPDPVVALVAERFRIEEECEAAIAPLTDDDAVADLVGVAVERIGRLDEQIAGTVALSAAGIVGQVRVLHELGHGTYRRRVRRAAPRHDRRRDRAACRDQRAAVI
jgi:hypothetical protein